MAQAVDEGLSLEEFLERHGLDENGKPLPDDRDESWWDKGDQSKWQTSDDG